MVPTECPILNRYYVQFVYKTGAFVTSADESDVFRHVHVRILVTIHTHAVRLSSSRQQARFWVCGGALEEVVVAG